jgi:recombination associated protein RdgC
MFRNLRLYRLDGAWPDDEAELSAQLAAAAFVSCGALTERSAGFEPPAGDGAPEGHGSSAVDGAPAGDRKRPLARRVGGADLMRLRTQTRILPAAAINEALEERIGEFRRRTLRDPSRKERRDLKDEVRTELLPRALLKSTRLRACYVISESVLGVDTASATQAEHFIDQLRAAFGSLNAVPLAFRRPPRELMTQIFLGDGPRNFLPGRECRMQDAAADGAYVHWSDMELTDQSVRRHVREGLKLDRLAVIYDNLIGFVIDGDCVLRKVKLQGLEGAGEEADEDPLARLDAEFVMLSGMLRRVLADLKTLLGGYA